MVAEWRIDALAPGDTARDTVVGGPHNEWTRCVYNWARRAMGGRN